MAPPIEPFPASKLPVCVQITTGKMGQPTFRDNRVDLKKCKLLEMEQFHCEMKSKDLVVCEPIVRLFRK
jgi:Mitochondrial export protein Som1